MGGHRIPAESHRCRGRAPVARNHLYGSELISDLRDRVEALMAGADMEVLRIKNARIMEHALERDDDADTLDALDVYEVFERCLAAHGVPDEQRPDLRLAYRETVASFLEEDPHA